MSSTEPTATAPLESVPATEPAPAPAVETSNTVSQFVDAPTTLPEVKEDEKAEATATTTTVPEETVSSDPVPEPATVEATKEKAEQPAPSKSTSASKRISLFLGKAKNFVDKKVSDKKAAGETNNKVDEHPPTVPEETSAANEATDAAASDATPDVATNAPVSEEHVAETTESKTTDKPAPTSSKSEKRKSILGLGSIFRSKSPVPTATATTKEADKLEETPKAPEETTVEKEATTEPIVAEHNANGAASSATDEQPEGEANTTTAAGATKEHKENVINTIKKGPLGKFFNKKKETEQQQASPASNTTDDQPVTTTSASSEDQLPATAEPAVETVNDKNANSVEPADAGNTESSAPAPAQEQKRSGSPLGRRITQMFRNFNKKKHATNGASTATTEENKETANDATEGTNTSAAVTAPVEEEARQAEEPTNTASAPVAAPVPTTTAPVVQATA